MKKNRRRGTEEAVVECLKCGTKHRFESLDAIGLIPLDTPCDHCGSPYLMETMKKLEELLEEAERGEA